MTVREVVALLGISFEVVELRQAQCGLVLTLDVQLPLAVAYGGEAAVLIVEVVDRRVCHARGRPGDGPGVRAGPCPGRLRFDPRVSTPGWQQGANRQREVMLLSSRHDPGPPHDEGDTQPTLVGSDLAAPQPARAAVEPGPVVARHDHERVFAQAAL